MTKGFPAMLERGGLGGGRGIGSGIMMCVSSPQFVFVLYSYQSSKPEEGRGEGLEEGQEQ